MASLGRWQGDKVFAFLLFSHQRVDRLSPVFIIQEIYSRRTTQQVTSIAGDKSIPHYIFDLNNSQLLLNELRNPSPVVTIQAIYSRGVVYQITTTVGDVLVPLSYIYYLCSSQLPLKQLSSPTIVLCGDYSAAQQTRTLSSRLIFHFSFLALRPVSTVTMTMAGGKNCHRHVPPPSLSILIDVPDFRFQAGVTVLGVEPGSYQRLIQPSPPRPVLGATSMKPI